MAPPSKLSRWSNKSAMLNSRSSRFVAVGIFSVLAATLGACGNESGSGTSNATASLSSTGSFDKIQVANGVRMTVERGERATAEVKGTGISNDQIQVAVADNTLTVMAADGTVPPGAQIEAKVSAVSISSITATSGASIDFVGDMDMSNESGELNVSSGASVTVPVNSKDADVKLQAGGKISINGASQSLSLVVTESGEFSGADFTATSADVTMSSGGTASVKVTKKLIVDLTTGAALTYSGQPKVTKKRVASGATLSRS